MLKLLTAALMGASITLAGSPAIARTIWIPGRTNNGSKLFLDTMNPPQKQYKREVSFSYGIFDGKEYRWRNGYTYWCYRGGLLKPDNGETRPGWWVDLGDSEYFERVEADSPASRNLLKAVCASVK